MLRLRIAFLRSARVRMLLPPAVRTIVMKPRDHACNLVECFTKYVALRDDAVSQQHLRVATEWLRLIDLPNPSPVEIESLRASIDTLGDVGSASVDLTLAVRAWAARADWRAKFKRSP